MQPQLPGTAESHLFGRPRALPLYPIASTFSSRWSVTTVPTWSRTQVERLASSSAMRMYTSYRGMRSTGGGADPFGSRLRAWVFATTPSLATLMQLLVGIVVPIAPARPLVYEPGVEAGWHQAVGALLALRGAHRERVGVFVLGVAGVPAHPAPLDGVAGRGLHQLLPQRKILDRAPLAAPPAGDPCRYPLRHALDQVLRVRHVHHLHALPLTVQPLERRDGARERHLLVRRVGRALVQVPPRHAVARGSLDQGGVPAAVGRLRAVAEAALVRVHQDAGRGRTGHLRAG